MYITLQLYQAHGLPGAGHSRSPGKGPCPRLGTGQWRAQSAFLAVPTCPYWSQHLRCPKSCSSRPVPIPAWPDWETQPHVLQPWLAVHTLGVLRFEESLSSGRDLRAAYALTPQVVLTPKRGKQLPKRGQGLAVGLALRFHPGEKFTPARLLGQLVQGA